MLDFHKVRFGELPPSVTYSERSWNWTPSVPEWRQHHFLGSLIITQARGSRKEHSEYTVEELPPLPGLVGRRFSLSRDGGEGALVIYETTIGALAACTCMAGQCRGGEKRVCKHIDAINAIVALGLLGGETALVLDSEQSGLWHLGEPGEATVSELATLEALEEKRP